MNLKTEYFIDKKLILVDVCLNKLANKLAFILIELEKKKHEFYMSILSITNLKIFTILIHRDQTTR